MAGNAHKGLASYGARSQSAQPAQQADFHNQHQESSDMGEFTMCGDGTLQGREGHGQCDDHHASHLSHLDFRYALRPFDAGVSAVAVSPPLVLMFGACGVTHPHAAAVKKIMRLQPGCPRHARIPVKRGWPASVWLKKVSKLSFWNLCFSERSCGMHANCCCWMLSCQFPV